MQSFFIPLSRIKFRKFALPIIFCMLGLGSSALYAQTPTATVTALTGQSCAGTRATFDLGCTANDFAVGLSFTQPALNAIQNCIAGEFVTIDAISSVTSGSPTRYDVGIFIGENGNDPRQDNAANLCSLGVFPTFPTPFFTDDTDVCGDYLGSSSATLEIRQVRLLCKPAPNTNLVNVPYVVAWDNNNTGPTKNTCTTSTLTANTTSKCVSSNAASVVGLVTLGYVTVTKATTPATATETFAFNATASPASTVTPSSFNLANGQSQRVTVPLSDTGGTRTLVVDETLTNEWGPGTAITCTNPSGGSAAGYVTIDNVNRRVTANLTAANYGALCTYTNTKKPTVTLRKTWVNAAVNDAVTVAATGLTSLAAVANTANETDTGVSQPVSIGSVLTLSETFTPVVATNYSTSLACTGTAGLSGNTLTVGAADTAIVCTYTNTSIAVAITISKTDSKAVVPSGGTNNYVVSVSNAGPGAADGVIVTDTVGTGLTCPAADTVTCSVTSGAAVCPAGALVFSNLISGLVIATFPPNSALQFAYTCNVN